MRRRRVAVSLLLVLGLLAAMPSEAAAGSPGGAIEGTVTDGAGAPLPSILVLAYQATDGYSPSAATATGGDGTYSLEGLAPADYKIFFVPYGPSTLRREWHSDAQRRSDATPIVVTAGSSVSGIDASLVPGGSISGVVTDAGGMPVESALVAAFAPGDRFAASYLGVTGADGAYALPGVQAGSYRLRFRPAPGSGLDAEWHQDKATRAAANPVVVASGTQVVDASLNSGTSLDPVVKIPSGGTTVTVSDTTGTVVYENPADVPAVSEFVVTNGPDGLPYYGVVTGVQGTTVQTRNVSLADVVPQADFTVDIPDPMNAPGVGVADGATLLPGDAPVASRAAGPKEFAQITCNGGVSFDIKITPSFGLSNLRVGGQWEFISVESFYATVDVTAEFIAEATLQAQATCNGSVSLLEIPLPTINFTVGPVPVAITQSFGIALAGDVTAQGSLSAQVGFRRERRVGFSYTRGSGLQLVNEALPQQEFVPHFDTTATLTASVELPITYSARAYGLVGFDVSLTPGVALQAKPPGPGPDLTVDAYLDLSASIEVSLKKSWILSWTQFNLSHQIFRTRLFSFPLLREEFGEPPTLPDPSTPCSATLAECGAVQAVYAAMGVPPGSGDPCTWQNGLNVVGCANGAVTSLSFGGPWTGSLPAAIGSLTNLQSFIATNSFLTGPIPPEIGQLTNLTYLQLTSNELTGPIPPQLGNLKKLVYLDLIDNQLTGPIPSQMGSMTSLQALGLRDNSLSGPIPPELLSLNNLVFLSLDPNGCFTGTTPAVVAWVEQFEPFQQFC